MKGSETRARSREGKKKKKKNRHLLFLSWQFPFWQPIQKMLQGGFLLTAICNAKLWKNILQKKPKTKSPPKPQNKINLKTTYSFNF